MSRTWRGETLSETGTLQLSGAFNTKDGRRGKKRKKAWLKPSWGRRKEFNSWGKRTSTAKPIRLCRGLQTRSCRKRVVKNCLPGQVLWPAPKVHVAPRASSSAQGNPGSGSDRVSPHAGGAETGIGPSLSGGRNPIESLDTRTSLGGRVKKSHHLGSARHPRGGWKKGSSGRPTKKGGRGLGKGGDVNVRKKLP